MDETRKNPYVKTNELHPPDAAAKPDIENTKVIVIGTRVRGKKIVVSETKTTLIT